MVMMMNVFSQDAPRDNVGIHNIPQRILVQQAFVQAKQDRS